MKEEKPIFLKAFTIVILILLINIGVFTYNSKESIDFNKSLTGFLVNEVIFDNSEKINPLSKIFILIQWSFLGLILVFASVKDVKLRKQKIELKSIKINPSKEQTDLDKIYNILKERKQMKVKNVARLFKVEYSVALEWAKILESGNLADIDYPMLGGPILNLKIKEVKDTQTDKKQNLNKEQLKTDKKQIKPKKSKAPLILFITALGFAAYPIYWLSQNNWAYRAIPEDKLILTLSIIFLFFLFIFLITLIKRIFTRKKKEIKSTPKKNIKTKQIPKKENIKTKQIPKEEKQLKTSKKKKTLKQKNKKPSKRKPKKKK